MEKDYLIMQPTVYIEIFFLNKEKIYVLDTPDLTMISSTKLPLSTSALNSCKIKILQNILRYIK